MNGIMDVLCNNINVQQTCGSRFKTISALYNHRPRHKGKQFQCPHCTYRATSKNMLIIHDRVHSRVKPYQCDVCKMKFSTNSNMRKHIRNIHEKQKMHKVKFGS